MRRFLNLTARNIKLYFSDKALFFTSLITPAILLILFVTFLGEIYKDTFLEMIPKGMTLSDELLNGLVSGQLTSSVLAVSCVTVAFCSNFLMVQDKVNGIDKDFSLAPISPKTLRLSYFAASLFSTLLINVFALCLCLIYTASNGWFLNGGDVLRILFRVVLLTLFGSVLSSVINGMLKTQGQITVVGTIVSSMYGFLCGAYMPMSSFSDGIRNTLLFLPGTYGTVLIRNSVMSGTFRELGEILPDSAVDAMKTAVDYHLVFFEHDVSVAAMYAVLIGAIAVLLGVYIVQGKLKVQK